MYEVSVFASPVTVTNASFEADASMLPFFYGDYAYGIDGWEVNGSGGVWTPSATMFPGGIPDGDSVCWLNSGSISQNLEWYVNAGNTLTLEVDVSGCPYLSGESAAFSIEIWAGENLLASNGAGVGTLTNGEFETWMVSYVIDDEDPLIGQQLSIAFNNLGGPNRQLDFDNVRFENDLTHLGGVPQPSPVPEPSTMLLLGVGLLGFSGVRRKYKK